MDRCGGIAMVLLSALVSSSHVTGQPEKERGNKLLIIVLDGYRWDYRMLGYPGFNHVRINGVESAYLHPTFPTTAMPNLHSIMTGLYPESHGITGDYMYDTETGTSFTKMNNWKVDSEPMWWNSGDPLWISATRQGKKTYMFHWPGCDVFIHGIKPTYCKPVVDWSIEKDDFRHSVQESVKLLANDSADFIGIFYSEPDRTGHITGTHSAGLDNKIAVIDDVIGGLHNQLEATSYMGDAEVKLTDVTDIMIMSTHGMMNISPHRQVELSTVLNMSGVEHVLGDHTLLQIWPKPGHEEEIINDLNGTSDHARVYRKEDLPDHLHYKNGQYVAPVIVMAEPGYTLLTPDKPSFPTGSIGPTPAHLWAANHGYDSQASSEMRGMFMAMGPHFRVNRNYPDVENVCLYQIMCAILNIESNPHNGTWSAVRNMLVGLEEPGKYEYPNHISKTVVVLIVFAVIFCIISITCGLYIRRENIKNLIRKRGPEWQPLHDGVV